MNISKLLIAGASSLVLSSTLLAGIHTTHWGYTGHSGPEHWGDLNPKHEMCKNGKNQSPINLTNKVMVDTDDLTPLNLNYKASAHNVVNNGHTVQVNVENGSSITVDGIEFFLKQFHFHTPSENQIDGKNFPLEAHFVHVSKAGELAVVALMFEDGAENKVLKKIWAKQLHKVDEKRACGMKAGMINKMLPKDKSYYRFTGSLTTPPCSEGVRWFVLKNYSHISAAQTKQFLEFVHHENNRPTQAINARKVLK